MDEMPVQVGQQNRERSSIRAIPVARPLDRISRIEPAVDNRQVWFLARRGELIGAL